MTIFYRTPDGWQPQESDFDYGTVGMANLGGRHYMRPPHRANAVVTHSRRAAADTFLLLLQGRQDVADALFETAARFAKLEPGMFIRIIGLADGQMRVDVTDAERGSSLDAITRTDTGAVLYMTPRHNAASSSITLSSTDEADEGAIANALLAAAEKAEDGYPIIIAATADDYRLQIEALGWPRDAKTKTKARQVAKTNASRAAQDKIALSSALIAMWVDDEDDDD